jgi:hypothetical protein
MPVPIPDYHVVVHFGGRIPADVQGRALMRFERELRELSGLPCEVFKETMGDDSKLRRAMTPVQRAKL